MRSQLITTTAILSLLPASTALSSGPGTTSTRVGGGQHPENLCDDSSNSFTSPLRNSLPPYGCRLDILQQQRRRRTRRRDGLNGSSRGTFAPLVDSTLLRFLSTQRKQLQQQNKKKSSPTKETKVPLVFTDFRRLSPTVTYLDSLTTARQTIASRSIATTWSPEFDFYEPQENSFVTDESQVTKPNGFSKADLRLDDTFESWLGQYNRNRVAQKLIELGVADEATAYEAGEVVQEYALARTARRRVRNFLRQRDVDWANRDLVPYVSLFNTTESKYGFDDILKVFVEFGLNGNDVTAILTHTPSLAFMMPRRPNIVSQTERLSGETLHETLSRAFSNLLCDRFKLRKYDARKVLRSSPGLLTMRGSRNAEQVVSMLSKLGVSASSIARDKNALPVLLSRSPAALFRLVAFLSSDAVRMPIDSIGPLLRRRECLDLLDAVAPVPPTLDQVNARPLDRNDLVNGDYELLLSSASGWSKSSQERRLRINETYRRMSSTAWTLRHEVGTADLGKIVAAYPSVLLLGAKDQILPAASYLMDELGIWKDDLARVLQLYPALLGVDVDDMRSIVSYLLSLGVAEENLASIFRSFPALLTLRLKDDMIPVVEFLRSAGLTNIGRFVTRLPPVLGYCIKSELAPKWDYLKRMYSFPSFELSKFPAYFSYPLERVIKTRFEYLRIVKRIPTQLSALDHVLRFGDRDFATKVAGDKDGGAAFADFVRKRSLAKAPDGRSNNKVQQRQPIENTKPS